VVAIIDGTEYDIVLQMDKGIRLLPGHLHPCDFVYGPDARTIRVYDRTTKLPVGNIVIVPVPGTWRGLTGMDDAGSFIECGVLDVGVYPPDEMPEVEAVSAEMVH
jgi:hypothetical protein